MTIRQFLEKNSRILEALAALIAIMLFLFAIIKFLFEPADVEVTVSMNDANLPASIAEKYSNALDSLLKTVEKKQEKNYKMSYEGMVEVSKFLRETAKKANYVITNNSSYTIKNVDIRIKNVTKLTAWGVTGNMLQVVESQSIMRKMKIDGETGIITFGNIEKLPPKSNLVISIWGNVREFFVGDIVYVTYDGGSAKITRATEITGFNSFIYENSTYLVLLLIILNTGLFLYIVDRTREKLKKEIITKES